MDLGHYAESTTIVNLTISGRRGLELGLSSRPAVPLVAWGKSSSVVGIVSTLRHCGSDGVGCCCGGGWILSLALLMLLSNTVSVVVALDE